MIITLDMIPDLVIYSLGFFILYFLLYRPYIYSAIDPLFIFVFSTAFGSVLALSILTDSSKLLNYFICQICLYIGFSVTNKFMSKDNFSPPSPAYSLYDANVLKYTMIVLFSIFIISNLIISSTKGFALLSDTPTTSKELNYREGFGIFRKISWAIGGVLSSGLFFLYLTESKRRYLIGLLIIIFFTSLEGSKGALLKFAVCFGHFIYHPIFNDKKSMIKKFNRFAPLGAIPIFGIFFIVLGKENESFDQVIIAFVRRLLYGADSLIYFYNENNVNYFAKYGPFDYPNYIINPLLGFLRITTYQEAFGNVMVENVLQTGTSMDFILGPNTTFYVEGQIFFGYFGVFLYSFVLGSLVSYIRSYYFSLRKTSAFHFIYISTLAQFSLNAFSDLKFAITQTYDTVVLVLSVYVLVNFVLRKKLVFRKSHLN